MASIASRSLILTHQESFGGAWTQQKLEAIGKYLRAYTTIFKRNPRATFFRISYVDAFAGTGTLRLREVGLSAPLIPELRQAETEFRKGSARRALEVEPPFDEYVFIEKNARKCEELSRIATDLPNRKVQIVNEDANTALLKWCSQLDSRRERAVVFLDPFGASVTWDVIATLGRTRAVDLWILFPYFAINRMLVRNRKPPKPWADRLTAVLGTTEWERAFYSTSSVRSLFDPSQLIESVQKSVDYREITEFFARRLRTEFVAVSRPLPLLSSKSLLFNLFFAAGNERSAKTGLKIANDIIDK